MTARRHDARGFTLIELMVSVVLSGVVIGFLFQIHGQMVGAMRGQANVSEIAESVTAARELIARELRSAGMGFPATGVRWGVNPGEAFVGITVRDDATGTGDLDVADFLEIQREVGETVEITNIDDSVAGVWRFNLRDPGRLLSSRPGFATPPAEVVVANGGNTLACVVPVMGVDDQGFTFDEQYFEGTGRCVGVVTAGASATANVTIMERVAFQLDPDPATFQLGVLQRFNFATSAWEPIGIGFTNFQVAVRYFEPGESALALAVADLDADGDTTRDWYSGPLMETGNIARTPTVDPTEIDIPIQIGFSIEARNVRRIEAVSSTSTPGYTAVDPAQKDNNPLGNFGESGGACAGTQYDPCGVPDLTATSIPRYYPGHVYRSTSTTVWLRNRLGQL
jgi:prepilin-type N-terminal cleavage/methylation domain-containing protein